MEKSATCTATGNIEYWECKNCGNCFSHSDGETEITLADTIISKLEHDFDNGIFIHNDDTHSKICKDCDAMSEEVNHGCVTKKDFDYHWQECECGYKKDVKEHTLKQKRNTTHHWLECSCGFTGTEHEHEKTTTISYVAPSMCKDVGSAEYMCKCGFRFSEIIPAIHAFENGELGIHVEEKASTCTENGNIEYWQCNTCLKLFKDAKAKEEITAGEIVILSKGHCSAGNCEWILNENGLSHAKKCTVCNTISEWEEHVMKTYSSSTTSHWSGCECGLLESGEVPIAHEFVCIYNDDCHKLLCEICGYVSEGEEHSLVYVKTSEYHRLQCSCGFKSAPVSHEYTHAHNISSHYDECVCGFTVNEAEHNLETRSSLEAHWIACEGCDYSTERIPHELELRHNDTHHWYECDCGWLTSAKAHYMSPATDGNYIWTECSCGFATSKSDKKRNNIT